MHRSFLWHVPAFTFFLCGVEAILQAAERGTLPHGIAVFLLLIWLGLTALHMVRSFGRSACGLCLPVSHAKCAVLTAPLLLLWGLARVTSGGMPVLEAMPVTALWACGEELLFRGYLTPILKRYFRTAVFATALLSGALFALFHVPNLLSGMSVADTLTQVLFAFGAGTCFVALKERTGSLLPAAIIHTGLNLSTGTDRSGLPSGAFRGVWIAVSLGLTAYGLWLAYRTGEKRE